MNNRGNTSGATPARPPVPDLLAALAAARTSWVKGAVRALRQQPCVAASWLVGSLGRGTADPYSDIDLVVAVDPGIDPNVVVDPVGGLRLPGPVLFTRAKPRNAPAGGAYRTVCIELAALPVLVDLYLWPTATAAVPVGGRVLHHSSQPPRSRLEFMALLNLHRTNDTTGADADDPASVLLLVQLAGKYLARDDHPRYDATCRQLRHPATRGARGLRRVLSERIGLTTPHDLEPAVAAAHRLLDLIEARGAG